MFYVYIIYSIKTDRYYTGYCSDIETRIVKHNLGATASTRSGIPWKLVYFETFENKADAIRRELEIKRKKSRKYIEYLVSTLEG